jgi:fibro-slime domain-containing protein
MRNRSSVAFTGFLIVVALSIASPAMAATIDLTGTIRDFNDTHPDFESSMGTDRGIVEGILGADGKPVYAHGYTGTTTTTDVDYFNQWYRDVGGVNLSKPYTITLDNTITPDPNVFTFSSGAFFPIDNELFGNQGRGHNYHFTFELHTQFTYLSGEGMWFTFTGDDDLWVFINKELVIDLGGVHQAETASVSLDDLGLTGGETYSFDLFFAERHTSLSTFCIDTSIVLEPTPCEGDFDNDTDVDGSDLAVFAADFGRTDCLPENPCQGDFDDDGDVDGSDLAVFAADFGRTDCP